MRFPFAVALLVGTLVAGAAIDTATGAPSSPSRFEVLQTAFHDFSQHNTTRQAMDARCVLVELFADSQGDESSAARNATHALLNVTTRADLALAAYQPAGDPLASQGFASRLADYYAAGFLPATVFDGTVWELGGGASSLAHAQGAYNATKAVPAGASLNVSGELVVNHGFIDYEVFTTYDFGRHLVSVRAALVEDLVATGDGRELRFLVRSALVGALAEFGANGSFAGRITFPLEAGWAPSRLAAVVFVQVDSERAPAPGVRPSPYDPFAAVLVPVAVATTGTVLALIFLRLVRSERRARRP